MKYLFVDTETGGIGLDKSLLEVGLIITDEDFNIQDEHNILVRPNDGIYHVTSTALQINYINLAEHTGDAITYRDAGTLIYGILDEWIKLSNDKLVVVGKNVYGDLYQIWDKLIKRQTWEQFCSYQVIDLTAIWKWLEITGKVPKLSKTSLSDIAEHLNVRVVDLHQALGDCRITLQCLKQIKNMSCG